MNELESHIDRGAEARRRITERFLEATQTPSPNPDPVAVPGFLTMRSFRHLTDGTLVVSFFVPPHLSHETYMTLIPFCREMPLAISLEQIPEDKLMEVIHKDA